MKKFQILVDSASDLYNNYLDKKDIAFKVIPLTVTANEKDYVDDDNVDIDAMLADMHACKKNTSACPAPNSFLQEFDNAEYTFIVTITSKLSGCYNAAVVAKNSYEKPDNIFVIDSKATSGTEILLVDKLVSLIEKGLSYEEICEKIINYRDKKSLFFILQKFDNLINNGRMSKIAGFIANTLAIKPICIAKEGEIAVAKKVIGIKNAFRNLIQMIKDRFNSEDGGKEKLIISHCKNEEDALYLKEEIAKVCDFKEIEVVPMKGLCSFYALEKGLILCH